MFIACGRSTQAIDSIDLNDWNAATILVMEEKMHLNSDSVLSALWGKYYDSLSYPERSVCITNHEKYIHYPLSFREKILKTIKEQSFFPFKSDFYIREFQSYSYVGFTRGFSLYRREDDSYRFEYKGDSLVCNSDDTTGFTKEKLYDLDYYRWEKHKPYNYFIDYSQINYLGMISGMEITTHISKNRNDEVCYDVKEVCVW